MLRSGHELSMPADPKHALLDRLPSITELLKSPTVLDWLQQHPRPLVTQCVRDATAQLRHQVLTDGAGRCGPQHLTPAVVLERAATLLSRATTPHLRAAINATGVILHTGLGRAVFPEAVVEDILPELKGYCTLAVDPETGERLERDELIESLLTELTGAEAATVVNNNAAATLLVLAALAAQREVIVSRGQLIEIGGSFRLPEVMAQSQARLVEVGATNRTHLKDYRNAITDQTAALLRVHPSNYRIVGFTAEPTLAELAELAHARGLMLIDDLGAGALVGLEAFGLPHEPTVQESIGAGADIVLFSGDKLIGASQSGIVVGRRPLIQRLRQHPLMRAMRVDKTCLLVLERTLQMFRRPDRLAAAHPTYRMMHTPREALLARARTLASAISSVAPQAATTVREGVAYLGSGSLPTESLPSAMVTVQWPAIKPTELARRLRVDPVAVFGRVEADLLCLDVRTVSDAQVPAIAEAFGRLAAAAAPTEAPTLRAPLQTQPGSASD
jgi:L-seryl-tRNA(Ser) seleniumtransferase